MSNSSSFATVALLSKALGQLATTARTFQKVLQSFVNEPDLVEVVREVVQPTKSKKKRFECEPCNYSTTSPSDFRKHCSRDKHLKNTDRRKDERRFGDGMSTEFSKLMEKYGLGEEVSIYTKMAYCWLHPTFRQSTGQQAMGCRPMTTLWETVHEFQFGGGYYMKGSRNQLFNKTLDRTAYNFGVFEEIRSSASRVYDEAETLIEARGKHTKFGHNIKNWSNFDIAMERFPRFLKDKSPGQKKLHTMSLHEYLQSCR